MVTIIFLRAVWNGQGKNQDKGKEGQRMPKLWTHFLNVLDFVGDKSGCHQIPERCLHFGSYIMPLCARCTGVLIGEILSFCCLLVNVRFDFVPAICLVLLMGFDWFIQEIGLHESTNPRRLIT